LGHPDKEHQKYWINWFKRFIDVGIDLGANHVGSHLGIFLMMIIRKEKNF
jgi:hypothetical protein